MTRHDIAIRFAALVCASLIGLPQAAYAAAPTGPADVPPAIGYDWMDMRDSGQGVGPSAWPRGDEAAAGLDDMILDERDALLGREPARGPGVVRFARRMVGDYVVVPVLRLHFRRGGG